MNARSKVGARAQQLTTLFEQDVTKTIEAFVARWNQAPLPSTDRVDRPITALFGPFGDSTTHATLELWADGTAALTNDVASADVRIFGDPVNAARLLTNDIHPMVAYYRGGFRMHPDQATLPGAKERWQKICSVFTQIADDVE